MYYCIGEFYPARQDLSYREDLRSYWTVLSGPHHGKNRAERHGYRVWRMLAGQNIQGVPELIRIKVVAQVELKNYGLAPTERSFIGPQSSFIGEA